MFNQCLYCHHLFQHIDSYSATKAEGEALVIKSNGIKGLLTCCIRPSGIFGPGDKLFVPSLVSAARAGKSKVSMFIVLLNFEFVSFSVSGYSYDIQIPHHNRIHE
jgi:nucleoside-diphosphate-sugar epimerase